ncbi:TBC1 domain family member 10A-like [Salvelinus alpinus]|uniref:TBC1 domain family member 10A-like n=1 Tax=Salvelinus alpinus TaxID=8036 RepID=UPI0039FDBA63
MAKIENGRQSADSRSIRTISSSHMDDESSLGSDSEINGFTNDRHTDKYGFIGGAQQYSEESAQDVPPEVLRQREVKWLDMLSNWDKWMVKRHKKVRLRCQKGIPPSLRGRAWLYLSGGKVKREQNRGKFEELDSQAGDPKELDVIEKDLHRQFPFHEMFVSRGGHGQQDLFRVLKAYTLYRPEEGYCQAQAPIAAVLLMHMPAEDAFWGLVQICEKYLPGYYSAGLEAIQLDGEILYALTRRVSPLTYRHLEKHKIEPILYMTEWFMCAFSRTLPWASVLRVWDMFLCDGVKIIFRVGLVLLKCMLGTREKLKTCQGQYETMELLRAIEPRYMQEGFLVREVLDVPVSERDVESEHHVQLKRWRKNRGELHWKSPPRMHGARAIMASEPPSRQDLRQNPTIIVESPLPPPQPTPQLQKGEKKSKKEKKSIKKGSMKITPPPVTEIPNPYNLPGDPKLPLRDPQLPLRDPQLPLRDPQPTLRDSPVQKPLVNDTPLPNTPKDSHLPNQPALNDQPALNHQPVFNDQSLLKESPLQKSRQSLSSTEVDHQDTYL